MTEFENGYGYVLGAVSVSISKEPIRILERVFNGRIFEGAGAHDFVPTVLFVESVGAEFPCGVSVPKSNNIHADKNVTRVDFQILLELSAFGIFCLPMLSDPVVPCDELSCVKGCGLGEAAGPLSLNFVLVSAMSWTHCVPGRLISVWSKLLRLKRDRPFIMVFEVWIHHLSLSGLVCMLAPTVIA
ncbi:hypothetical protein [Burkholderia gladioli]|uniref:hypothetical protein n=1 Tax=Burkholderia gladioli TaxID=28095 RepID=UPI002FDF0DB4